MATHADRMMALFAGWEGAYGTHGEPTRKPDTLKWEIRSTASTIKKPVTVQLWQSHLEGRKALGIICIREDGKCRWGSIDYDVYDANLLELIVRASRLKLPLVPCRSKSGGLHLFLFMREWVDAEVMRNALTDIAAQLGIAGSEIFPKQTAVLVERGDLGSWMVMPYFGDTFGGKIQEQVGLKKNGAEMIIDEFLAVAEETLVDIESLVKMARKRPTRPRNENTGAGKRAEPGIDYPEPDEPFGDGPPCLQTLASDKVKTGKQNNALMNMGTYYKMRYPENWEEHLERAAVEFLDPPGKSDGTQSVIKSLKKRDYYFTCRNDPLVQHCNAGLCRQRPFGVGDRGDFPIDITLRMLASPDDVRWFVSFGGYAIEIDTDTLYTYSAFQKACIKQVQVMFMPMKQMDWIAMIKPAIEKAESIEGTESKQDLLDGRVSAQGQIIDLVEDFLTDRNRGRSLADLLNGMPFYDEEAKLYYFRFKDLRKFVFQEGLMKNATQDSILLAIKAMGAKQLKNVQFRYWSVALDNNVVPLVQPTNPKRKSTGGI